MNAAKLIQNAYLLVGAVGLVGQIIGRTIEQPHLIAVSAALVCASLFVLCFKLNIHKLRMRKLAIVFVVSIAYIYLKLSFMTLPFAGFAVVLTVVLLFLSSFGRVKQTKG